MLILSAVVCTLGLVGACHDEDPLSYDRTPPRPLMTTVVGDSNCAKVSFTITSPTAATATWPNKTTCGNGLTIIRGNTPVWSQANGRKLSLRIRILNREAVAIQLPVRLFLPASGTTVLVPAGTPASKVVALNADSTPVGGGKVWMVGGTGVLAVGDSTVLDTIQFNVQSPVTQARFAFVISATMPPPLVPIIPPDSQPAWFKDDSSYTDAGAGYLKRVVTVLFQPGATQSQRQAAVNAVNGSVIGGLPISGGEGYYDLLIQDDGSGTQLQQAIQLLKSLPQVKAAGLNYRSEGAYLRPMDGSGWQLQDWALSPASAAGSNWAGEQIAGPMAWGCETGNAGAHITVLDGPFDNTETMSNVVQPWPTLGGTPLDTLRHGTRVSSLIAAPGNNQLGITGVMWKAGIKLIDLGGRKTFTGVTRLIAQEAAAGTHIVNLSQQKTWNQAPSNAADSQSVENDLALMWPVLNQLKANGTLPLLVIAAGNIDRDAYWSAYPRLRDSFPDNVIVVGASTQNLSRWHVSSTYGSNFGPRVNMWAPGAALTALDPGNALKIVTATSYATPLVTGAAGLLKSFDSQLTAADLVSLLRAGADSGHLTVSGQAGSRVLNIYESLKLAAQRPGAPLCGNRIWSASNGTIKVRRDALLTETIATVGDTVWGVTPMHGGKRIEYSTITGKYVLLYNAVSRNWQSAPVQSYPDSIPGGTATSVTGASHDRDSAVVVSDTTWAPGEAGILDIIVKQLTPATTHTIGSFNISIPPMTDPPSYPCAGMDGGGQCLGYWGYYDNLHYQFPRAFYSPRGDAVLVVMNYMTHFPEPLTWYPCSQLLGSGTAVQCRDFNFNYASDSAVVWSIAITSGTQAAQRLGVIPGRAIFWLGVSEADDALVMGVGYKDWQVHMDMDTPDSSGVRNIVTSCQYEFRSRNFSTPLQSPIAASDACHIESYGGNNHTGGGTIASSRSNIQLLPEINKPYLPSMTDIKRAWGY